MDHKTVEVIKGSLIKGSPAIEFRNIQHLVTSKKKHYIIEIGLDLGTPYTKVHGKGFDTKSEALAKIKYYQ